eukprot:2125094-Rhodomonas_salina.1
MFETDRQGKHVGEDAMQCSREVNRVRCSRLTENRTIWPRTGAAAIGSEGPSARHSHASSRLAHGHARHRGAAALLSQPSNGLFVAWHWKPREHFLWPTFLPCPPPQPTCPSASHASGIPTRREQRGEDPPVIFKILERVCTNCDRVNPVVLRLRGERLRNDEERHEQRPPHGGGGIASGAAGVLSQLPFKHNRFERALRLRRRVSISPLAVVVAAADLASIDSLPTIRDSIASGAHRVVPEAHAADVLVAIAAVAHATVVLDLAGIDDVVTANAARVVSFTHTAKIGDKSREGHSK